MLTLDVLKALVAAMESREPRDMDRWRENTAEAMREVMRVTRGNVNPNVIRPILEHHFKCNL